MKIWDAIKKAAMKSLPDDYRAIGMPPRPEPCWIESMKVLEYKPGDIIILKTAQRISATGSKLLREAVQEVIDPVKKGIQVMVLEDGMDIGVLRGEPCEP